MTAFALIDGNSFYCSCERVFDPALARRPVIVLSNNDGCAGVETAAQLCALPLPLARRLLTVTGERTVLELRGVACMALEEVPPTRKGCAVTRSFATPVTSLDAMIEAVSAYATRAAEKLRHHGLEAAHLTVFMHTSPFRRAEPGHSGSRTVHLPEASADTLELVRAARRGAQAVFRDGFRYSKAGVIMTDLIRACSGARPLFEARDRGRSENLMDALDALNGRFGRGTLAPASAGLKREWQTRFERRSPRYTTRIDELPVVSAAPTRAELPALAG